jgi:hypothetical protein
MSEKDIKLLWGRAGNRCSICRRELTEDKRAATASIILGEQAHIVGEKVSAARWRNTLADDEREGYHNKILLCPTCHTRVDKNEEDFPIEKLHILKSQHELWVRNTLCSDVDLKKQADDMVAAVIVDNAIRYCMLDDWRSWTSFAFAPTPEWPEDFPEKAWEFRRGVLGACWTENLQEIKNAAESFSIFFHIAGQAAREHSERSGGRLHAIQFYKSNGFNPNYNEDLKSYQAWLNRCEKLMILSTKAANWFAETVREKVDPMFLIENGKLLVERETSFMRFSTELHEFTSDEKGTLPSEWESFIEKDPLKK